ncbi:hypothetical protein HK405_009385, partial [Cladochytrium tenue]
TESLQEAHRILDADAMAGLALAQADRQARVDGAEVAVRNWITSAAEESAGRVTRSSLLSRAPIHEAHVTALRAQRDAARTRAESEPPGPERRRLFRIVSSWTRVCNAAARRSRRRVANAFMDFRAIHPAFDAHTMARCRARAAQAKGALDPQRINDYRQHFSTTFGGAPTGLRPLDDALLADTDPDRPRVPRSREEVEDVTPTWMHNDLWRNELLLEPPPWRQVEYTPIGYYKNRPPLENISQATITQWLDADIQQAQDSSKARTSKQINNGGTAGHPLISCPTLYSRDVARTLVHWVLGQVCIHQECVRCTALTGDYVEVSREHAIDCLDLRPAIVELFPFLTDWHEEEHGGTILDEAIRRIPMEREGRELAIALAALIKRIQCDCIGLRLPHDLDEYHAKPGGASVDSSNATSHQSMQHASVHS